jgi:hypothetical protein
MSDEFALSPVEQAIRQAMRDGLFDNLPGTGKPLKLLFEDDPNTPDDQRMAYKVMRDNDVAPTWMLLGQSITEQHEKIAAELARGYKIYRGAWADAERSGDLGRMSRVERTWERVLLTFEQAVAQYNRNVLLYNIKAPHGVPRRDTLDLAKMVAKLPR